MTKDTWTAPTAPGRLDATIRVPGSKSMTNRAFLLAALSTGRTTVRAPLESRDTGLMLDALSALGARHSVTAEGVVIDPIAPGTEPVSVHLGNAGTVARFTPALATLGNRVVRFDGDAAMARRPIAPLLGALRELGADIDFDAGLFTVRGHGGLAGGSVSLDSSASSQFLSALLLAGPAFDSGVTVRLVGAVPSEPHIEMTLDMLTRFGATPERHGQEFHVPPAKLSCTEITAEPDLSAAAPFVIAALVAGGTIRIPDWPRRTSQPGPQLCAIADQLGAVAKLSDDGLAVTGSAHLRGAQFDLRNVPEVTPPLAAALCLAESPSVISGVAHLRGQETDRLAALATELSALGAGVSETEDGLRLTPAPLRGGTFHTYDDHRLVMAAAVLGLRVPGIAVENPATVAKTFPGFVRTWEAMLDAPTGA